MCYRKKYIKNPVKKDHLTGFDKYQINVTCNSCPSCRKVRANDWLVRSYFEFLGNHRQAYFLSLDFDNQHLPTYKGMPCFDSKVVISFLKRLRYYIGSFRYFYSTDYGGLLKRPHYHLILLPDKLISLSKCVMSVKTCWIYGHYTNIESIDCVNNNKLKALQYVVSYTTKDISYNPDEDHKDMPPRFRPRCQASKGFGLRALEECLITPDMLLSGSKVALPIGKNGALRSFPIPRYYEIKLGYDYTWHSKLLKAELSKNEFGVELAKCRHNAHYVFVIKDFFASRHLNIVTEDYQTSPLHGRPWRQIVYDCLDNFDDFKEYIYYKDFICYHGNNYYKDTIRDVMLYRPSWYYYEMSFKIYRSFKKLFDDTKCQIEIERLIRMAKVKACKRVEQSPALRRYLVRKNFDFSKLYVTS